MSASDARRDVITINGRQYAPVEERERWYTVAEVAALTGVPKSTIYDCMARGALPYVVPNGCTHGRRISATALDAWMGARA